MKTFIVIYTLKKQLGKRKPDSFSDENENKINC